MDNYKKVSAIVLSGGKSSRMGEDKCDLEYHGETLLNLQIEKFKRIGIEDIVASGYKGNNCKARVVEDEIMEGPLSGILKGLQVIKNDRAFVISVDVPLVKEDSIRQLINYSFDKDLQIVLVRHGGKQEPLIGVYKKELTDKIENVISGENHSVMRLVDECSYEFLDIEDDDEYFLNINYRDDYDKLLKVKLEGGK